MCRIPGWHFCINGVIAGEKHCQKTRQLNHHIHIYIYILSIAFGPANLWGPIVQVSRGTFAARKMLRHACSRELNLHNLKGIAKLYCVAANEFTLKCYI